MHLTFNLGRYETHTPDTPADVEVLFRECKVAYGQDIEEWYSIKHELISQKRKAP